MPDNKTIDYEAAAEQLLAVLATFSHRANQDPALAVERPVGAAALARLVFGYAMYAGWSHETRRRRIRDTAVIARQQLARDQADRQIRADGRGYWLESDPAGIARYAARRRRQGLAQLKAASQIKTNLAPAQGQQPLFAPPSPPSYTITPDQLNAPIPKSMFRH